MSNGYSRDLRVDRVCDAFEAHFRIAGFYPHLEEFIESAVAEAGETPIDNGWRNELAVELIRLQFSLAESAGAAIDVQSLKKKYPRLRLQIDSAVKTNNEKRTVTGEAVFESAVNESLRPGQSMGPFELVSHLGMGGMGTVWKARQLQPVQRLVALKFVRSRVASAHLLARFRAERQALAVLNHPNIAKMLDASATDDGLPYFVMELVDGSNLIQHAQAEKLSIRERIELCLPVCQAVQHAHQKGIIHRDLKPSNILVARESGSTLAKVIDFGLAKAIETPLTDESLNTVAGQILGTPDYMSPEQTRLGQTDIDTRTDIYSLGAVLYQLLSGSRPFEEKELHKQELERTLQIIRDDDPIRPGKRTTADSRARELAVALEDVQRAQMDTQRKAADLRLVSDFQSTQLERINPTLLGVRIRESLSKQLANSPAAVSSLSVSKDDPDSFLNQANFTDLALDALKVEFFDRAQELINSAFEQQPAIRMNLLVSLGNSARKVGLVKASLDIQDQVLSLALDLKTNESPEVIDALQVKAGIVSELGNSDDAFRTIDEAVRLANARLTPDSLLFQKVLLTRAECLDRSGKMAEMELVVREIVGRTEIETLENSDLRRRARHMLGRSLGEQFKFEEAEQLLKNNLEIMRTKLESNDIRLISAIGEYGQVLERMRRYLEAGVLYKESLELAEANLGKYHPVTLNALKNYGKYLSLWNGQDEAIPFLHDAIARFNHAYGSRHPGSIMAESNLAASLGYSKKYDEAIAIRLSIIPRLVEVLGPEAEFTVIAKGGLGEHYGQAGRIDDGLKMLREAYQARQPIATHEFIPTAYFNLCMKAEERDEARRVAEEQLDLINQRSPDRNVERRIAIWNLSRWFIELEDWETAEPLLRDCVEIRDQLERDQWDYWTVWSDRSNLGEALMKQGKLDEAEAYLNDGYRGLVENAKQITPTFREFHIPYALRRLIEFHELRKEPEQVANYQKKLAEYQASLK